MFKTMSVPFPRIQASSFYFQGLTIRRATKDDQGLYECKVQDHSGNTRTKTEFIRILEKEEPYIRLVSFQSYLCDFDPSLPKPLPPSFRRPYPSYTLKEN
jgi:hypothetical protein